MDLSSDKLPAEVTTLEAKRSFLAHSRDGISNSLGRPVRETLFEDENKRLEPLFQATEQLEPLHKPEALKLSENTPLTPKQIASLRQKLRREAMRAGLKQDKVDFFVRLAFDEAKPTDNPSACREIRERKLDVLLPRVQEILSSIRQAPLK